MFDRITVEVRNSVRGGRVVATSLSLGSQNKDIEFQNKDVEDGSESSEGVAGSLAGVGEFGSADEAADLREQGVPGR